MGRSENSGTTDEALEARLENRAYRKTEPDLERFILGIGVLNSDWILAFARKDAKILFTHVKLVQQL